MKACSRLRVALWMLAVASAAQAGQLTVDTLAGPPGPIGATDFVGADARFSSPTGVAVDAGFNVYVADTNNHQIRKIVPGGQTTTLAGLPEFPGYAPGVGASAQFNHPTGLALDANGNLYIADTDNHVISRISPAGLVTPFAGQPNAPGSADGDASVAQFNSPRGLAFDSAGNLLVADRGNHAIRSITPAGVVSTIAGTPGTRGSADGTPGQFFHPTGVTVDGAGTIYVADSVNCTIRTISNGVVGTLAGQALSPGTNSGVGSQARFSDPEALVISNGVLYVADTGNHAIRTVTLPGALVTTVAGDLLPGSQDGTNTNAQFNAPAGLALKPDGRVLIADTGNHLVRVLEFQTPDYVTTTIAGQVAAMGVVNMPGADARFFKPFGICMGLGGTGTVLVADPPAQVVRFLSFDGTTVGTLCGTVGTPGTANGLTGQLNNPSGVTVLGSRVYIADTNNHAIRSYDSSLGLQTLAGTIGTPGASDGQFPTGKFRSPKGVYATGASTILVADSGNHTIRMLDTSSIVTTISGVAGSPGSADGGPSVARFNNPTGIVSDAAGRIFVADTDNHTIRMLFMTNFYTASTVAGQAGSPGFVDGTATQARFNHPTSLAISGNTLYVTDSDNDTIRAIDLTSFAVTTVAGQPGIQGSRDGFGPEALFQKPLGVAVDGGGFIYVTDSLNANIRKGHQTLSDFGAIDQDVAPVGDERQLNVFSETPESSYLWRIVRRPAGSTAELSSNTGDVVQFTPDVPDLYIFEMRAFGSGTELSISVIEFFASPLPPVIDSPLTADGVVGQLFSYAITATNNPVIFGISTLPPGLLFDPNTGVLYGTPTTSGVYNIDISAVNGGGSDTQTLVLTVKTPPALTLSSLDNPGLINTPVSFMFDVAATDPVTFQYLIDYGDGSMQDSGTITPGTPITTQHTYTQAGDFTVTVFLKDIEALVTSQSVVQTVFGPSSGGDGVKSASDDGKTILNPINGITIQVMNSNGGVIQLGIDVDALDRSAYDASTFFGDIAGRASTVIGPRPVHQFLNRGIFVAKTSGIHRVTHVVGGIARKTLVVGAKETGATVPTTRNARDARVVGDAPSSVISTKTLKGKFIFSGNKNDVVSYTGMIQLPAGLAVSAPHEFSIGIGNIVVDTMVDKKGKGEVPGNPAILKKLKLTYLKVKKGTITQGGEIARVDVTFNTAGMIDAGFDTEGIIRSATDAAGGKKAPRQIQIAMLLDGVPYTVLAPVTFTVSSTTAFGSISGRSGL